MPPPSRVPLRTYVWFTFHAPIEYENGRPRLPREFKTRDGSAFAEVSPLLERAGYAYGGQYLNIPCRLYENQPPPRPARGPGEEDWLADTDLVVLTIRPPISDPLIQGLGRRPIPRSHTWFENAVVDALGSWFFFSCSREAVQLSPGARQRVAPAFHDLRFLQNAVAGSWLKGKATDRQPGPRSTIGYVAYLPRLAGGELPNVLCVFGMGGNDTLRLCYFLRTRAPALLGRVLASSGPRLVLFRLTPPAEFDDLEVPPPGLLAPRYENWGFEQVADTENGCAP